MIVHNDNNLFNRLVQKENIEESWRLVRVNKGAAGIDGNDIRTVEENWPAIRDHLITQLRNRSYRPQAGRRVYIPKPNGKQRPLGIPTVRDRIIQQATRRIIEPIVDPTFEHFSYGFRPEKSAKQALEQVGEILTKRKLRWVIQIDLEQFFDTIPHETIRNAVGKHITDPDIHRLIGMFLEAGVMEEGVRRQTTTGTPQGGVISPLLANLVLDAVDKYVASHGEEGMVRYADDFVILAKTRRRAHHVMREIVRQLKKLGLTVNEEKSRIAHVSEGFTFLGYTFGGGEYHSGDGGTLISAIWKKPSAKAVAAFKDKMRILTRRLQPKNEKMLAERLNPVIRGWAGYFNAGFHKTLFSRLDEWYRMRLRSFIHKRKSYLDNYKNPISQLRETGFLFLSDFVVPAPPLPRMRQERLAMRV